MDRRLMELISEFIAWAVVFHVDVMGYGYTFSQSDGTDRSVSLLYWAEYGGTRSCIFPLWVTVTASGRLWIYSEIKLLTE